MTKSLSAIFAAMLLAAAFALHGCGENVPTEDGMFSSTGGEGESASSERSNSEGAGSSNPNTAALSCGEGESASSERSNSEGTGSSNPNTAALSCGCGCLNCRAEGSCFDGGGAQLCDTTECDCACCGPILAFEDADFEGNGNILTGPNTVPGVGSLSGTRTRVLNDLYRGKCFRWQGSSGSGSNGNIFGPPAFTNPRGRTYLTFWVRGKTGGNGILILFNGVDNNATYTWAPNAALGGYPNALEPYALSNQGSYPITLNAGKVWYKIAITMADTPARYIAGSKFTTGTTDPTARSVPFNERIEGSYMRWRSNTGNNGDLYLDEFLFEFRPNHQPPQGEHASTERTDPPGPLALTTWAADAAKPADQRPYNNYYGNAYGKTGKELKLALQTIIRSGHVNRGYSALWTMYQTSDIVPLYVEAANAPALKPGERLLWDIFSNTSEDGSTAAYWHITPTHRAGGGSEKLPSGGENSSYNREHLWSNSTFGGTREGIAGADGHHVYPVDTHANGYYRNIYPIAEVESAAETSIGGLKIGYPKTSLGIPAGTLTGAKPYVVEVRDFYKGDIARIYFYMAVRYYLSTDPEFFDCQWAYAGAKLKSWCESMIRRWHTADPVSWKEVDRNNAVHAFQGNRNPFIDYPELADLLDFTD